MSNIISTIILLLIPQIASAGLFDRDTKVRLTFNKCDSAAALKENFAVLTYILEKSSVTEKVDYYKQKKLISSDLRRLDNCVVANKNNWKCGGERTYGARGLYSDDATHKVIDGKYSFDPGGFNGKNRDDCHTREQLN